MPCVGVEWKLNVWHTPWTARLPDLTLEEWENFSYSWQRYGGLMGFSFSVGENEARQLQLGDEIRLYNTDLTDIESETEVTNCWYRGWIEEISIDRGVGAQISGRNEHRWLSLVYPVGLWLAQRPYDIAEDIINVLGEARHWTTTESGITVTDSTTMVNAMIGPSGSVGSYVRTTPLGYPSNDEYWEDTSADPSSLSGVNALKIEEPDATVDTIERFQADGSQTAAELLSALADLALKDEDASATKRMMWGVMPPHGTGGATNVAPIYWREVISGTTRLVLTKQLGCTGEVASFNERKTSVGMVNTVYYRGRNVVTGTVVRRQRERNLASVNAYGEQSMYLRNTGTQNSADTVRAARQIIRELKDPDVSYALRIPNWTENFPPFASYRCTTGDHGVTKHRVGGFGKVRIRDEAGLPLYGTGTFFAESIQVSVGNQVSLSLELERKRQNDTQIIADMYQRLNAIEEHGAPVAKENQVVVFESVLPSAVDLDDTVAWVGAGGNYGTSGTPLLSKRFRHRMGFYVERIEIIGSGGSGTGDATVTPVIGSTSYPVMAITLSSSVAEEAFAWAADQTVQYSGTGEGLYLAVTHNGTWKVTAPVIVRVQVVLLR